MGRDQGASYGILSRSSITDDEPARSSEDDRKIGQVVVTRVGLRFPKDMSFPDWLGAGRQLARITDSFTWCIGDWVAYGLNNYTDRYYRAIEEVGLDYKTIRNYAWVARRFEWPRRRADLSFQHHAEVAALPPERQDHWLELAARRKWSRNRLRQQLREARLNPSEDSSGTPETLKLVVSHETAERWRQAAELEEMPLEEWITVVADAQASDTPRHAG